MLKVSEPAVTIHLSEDANRAIQVLSEVMKSVFHIYDEDSRNPEKLYEVDAGETFV